MNDVKQESLWAREELLIGAKALNRLRAAQVAVCGLGGVGSYVAEALARSGVGALTLVDFDCVAVSNINRQLYALHSTIDQPKAELAAARIHDINPDCRLDVQQCFIDAENAAKLVGGCDYIADAIDNIPGKLALIRFAHERQIPLISAMGAGRRLDPGKLRIADISRTSICPLARIVRRELRVIGITQGVTVAFSEEPPVEQAGTERGMIGSMVFVPAAMGMMMAAEIVRRLIED